MQRAMGSATLGAKIQHARKVTLRRLSRSMSGSVLPGYESGEVLSLDVDRDVPESKQVDQESFAAVVTKL